MLLLPTLPPTSVSEPDWPSSFDQTVVWITGASSGIGEALARSLSAKGARIILSARREETLRSLAATLPSKALVLPLDITDEAAIARAVEQAWDWQGHIDLLVNNAGISQRALVLETSMDTARRVMDVNFFGAVALTAALAPKMVGRKSGHIVNITSVATYVAAPLRGFYSASKHALRAWSNTLRAELGGTGVDVTMICPGYVQTDIGKRALNGAGVPLQQDDPQVKAGLSPEELVARMLPAIVARKREVYVGGVEVSSIYLQRYVPWLVAWVLPDSLPWSDSGMMWFARRATRRIFGLSAPKRSDP